MALAEQLLDRLRADRIIVPAIEVLDRICSEALARGTRLLHARLIAALDDAGRDRLDALLDSRENVRRIGASTFPAKRATIRISRLLLANR